MHRSSLLHLFTALSIMVQICGCGVTCTVAPSISGQPGNQTGVVGQPALFTVAASGSPSLSYQWLKNDTPIPGANQPSYITPALSLADSDSVFAVTVQNRYGTITSSPATLTVTPSANSNVRFVAPTGNDSNPGTIDQPYQTIQHCATAVTQGWTCAVRAGTYRETVTPNSGITIAAYNLETVVVDGSDPVTGWVPYQGSIYKANVTLRSDDTNQIFVGSDMMTEARWPNGDDLFHVRWAIARAGTNVGHIVDSSMPQVNWTGAKIHLWSGVDPFGQETGTVTTSGDGQISIDVETGTCPVICPTPGGYYYLFGALAALDTEREWYYDSNSETLYFMAPGKVNPNTIDVRAKQRRYAFDLRGKSGVTVQNIGIFASSVVTDRESTNNTLDRINAQFVSQFTSLAPASNDPNGSLYSILAVHDSDSGIVINGTGNVLQNSTISYSAGTGVALEGSNNTIRNNLIQDIDYVGDYSSGIVIDGNGNIIQNNTADTTGRQAFLINAVLNQDISYNNLFDTMMLSRDGAAIYACCLQNASGTRIHHNWIHDTKAVTSGFGDTYGLSGITLDANSQGFEVDQNVVWSNQRDNIHIYGGVTGYNNNYVHNNTVPDDSSHGSITIEAVTDCSKTRVAHNQVVVSVDALGDGSACDLIDNSGDALGATEMTPSTQVGCNFDGCASNPPPAITGGRGVTPCPAVATDSQPPNLARSAGCGKARTQRETKDREVSSIASARKELPYPTGTETRVSFRWAASDRRTPPGAPPLLATVCYVTCLGSAGSGWAPSSARTDAAHGDRSHLP